MALFPAAIFPVAMISQSAVYVLTSCKRGSDNQVENKDFIRQRICIYAGKDLDPIIDDQVEKVLRSKFNIQLPQRASLNESLASAISDHEIIGLILKYRKMC